MPNSRISPTCTSLDEKVAKKLGKIAGINLEEQAQAMFKAGSSLAGKTAEDICFQDFKQFTVNDMVFGVGQLNSMSKEELQEVKEMLTPYLPKVLEKNGDGLNLTWETRDGILNHRTSGHPSTLEGQVVRFSDKIAYVHHDMDDAQRAGIITENDISASLREFLGQTTRERLNTFVHDVIEHSIDQPSIQMSAPVEQALMDLRSEMFQKVYLNPIAKREESKAIKMLTELYAYYIDHPEAMSKEYVALIEKKGVPKDRAVCDWLSGMTDQYSMKKFKEIFIPRAWEVY